MPFLWQRVVCVLVRIFLSQFPKLLPNFSVEFLKPYHKFITSSCHQERLIKLKFGKATFPIIVSLPFEEKIERREGFSSFRLREGRYKT